MKSTNRRRLSLRDWIAGWLLSALLAHSAYAIEDVCVQSDSDLDAALTHAQ
jgi:hypothetical protein